MQAGIIAILEQEDLNKIRRTHLLKLLINLKEEYMEDERQELKRIKKLLKKELK